MGRVRAGGRRARVLPEPEHKARAVRAMFEAIAPRYDLLNRVLTFGMDAGWRRRAARELALPPGSLVLDVACGTGALCRELERLRHRAVGFDFAAGMLAAAPTRAPLVQADALRLPVADGRADGLTCGFALRNVADLGGLFAEVARVLRPGGRAALLEVSTPANPLLRGGHSLYFNHVVPLVGGVLSDREAYRYLPRSMAYLPEPGRLLRMFQSSGFPDARRTPLSGGIAQLIAGTRA